MTIIATYHETDNVGLSNYIKNVFSCYKINLMTDQKINPFIDHKYFYIFSSIFENDTLKYNGECNFINFNLDDYIQNGDKNDYKYLDWRFFVSKLDNISIEPFGDEWFCRDIKSCIDVRYLNIPESIKQEYLQIIKNFKIRDEIINNVDKYNLTNYLGVHIRTWFADRIHSGNRYEYYLKVKNNFIDFINNSEYNNIFIAIDDEYEKNDIIKKIKDKNILTYINNDNLDRLQNDFSELLLLSKCEYLVGSLNSTFTELAWWYSNCNKNIKII